MKENDTLVMRTPNVKCFEVDAKTSRWQKLNALKWLDAQRFFGSYNVLMGMRNDSFGVS